MNNSLIDFVSSKWLAGVFGMAALAVDFSLLLFLSVRLRIDNIR